jgi:hypothetical protein
VHPSIQIRYVPVNPAVRYNETVRAADRARFEKVLLHAVSFATEQEPMPPNASEAVQQLYRDSGAGDEVQYLIREHCEKDDARVRYYDLWLSYAPSVCMTYAGWSQKLYGLEPVYMDPHEIRLVVDWEKKRIILKARIIGNDFPRFVTGEHVWYEETPTYMIPAPPIGAEGRGIKRRQEASGAAPSPRKQARLD